MVEQAGGGRRVECVQFATNESPRDVFWSSGRIKHAALLLLLLLLLLLRLEGLQVSSLWHLSLIHI